MCLDGRFYTVGKKGGFKTIYEAICAKSRKPMVDKKRVKRESQDLVDFLYAMSLWPVGSLAGTVR